MITNNQVAMFAMACVTGLMAIAMLCGVIKQDGVFLGALAAIFGMLAGKKVQALQEKTEVPNYGPAEETINSRTDGE